MKHCKPFSLSLQKELERRKISMDSEIKKSFNELGIKSLLHRSNITKQKGYVTFALLYITILLPFIQKHLSSLWMSETLLKQFEAHKDTYYRFLNHERFSWRRFVYLLVMRILVNTDDVPFMQKVLIADDTITLKTGKNMEMVSYHFDHKTMRSVLGYQLLYLAYHNGTNLFPLDMANHTSQKRPNNRVRKIDQRTNGYHRRQEALRKKTDVLVEMLDRAWNHGIYASFVLFDSWFSHDDLIAKILTIGYGVICRLKATKTTYIYQGQSYTLKQLWQQVAKKETQWLRKYGLKGVCLTVTLPKSGKVQVLFVSDGKKQWNAFLSTDLDFDPQEILTYYARRWAIEVFFKDCKQMLYLGKEQSETFEAVIACCTLVMIRYLLLVHILNKYNLTASMGPLFNYLAQNHQQDFIAEQIWPYIKDLMTMSSQLLWTEMESDKFLHFIEIVEDAFFIRFEKVSAKL